MILEQQGRHGEEAWAGSQRQASGQTHPASCSVTAHLRPEPGGMCLGVSTGRLWPVMAEGTFTAAPGKSTEIPEESSGEQITELLACKSNRKHVKLK